MHNKSNESTIICNSPLWDNSIFWLSSDPHFTECFRKTILITIGPIFLLLLTPLDFRYITKNWYSIPWRWRNVTYAILSLTIILLSFVNLMRSVWREVELWDNVFETSVDFIGFSISYLLLIIFRRYGRRISITLSIFWFINLIISVIRLYLEYKFSQSHNSVTNLIIYCLYISLSFNLLILSSISDEPNRISLISNRRLNDNYCALENNSAFSRLTLFWLFKFLYKGFKGKIQFNDLNPICHSIKSQHVSKLFKHYNQKYNSKALKSLSRFLRKDIRLLPVLWSLSYKYIFFGLLLQLIYLPSIYTQPYILDKLLSFLTNKNQYNWHGFVYAIIYCLSGLIAEISLLHVDTMMENTAIRCKSALVSAVYEKIFKLSPASKQKYASGEIINLMAVDCHEVFMFLEFSHYVFITPLSLSIGVYFLWKYLGIASLGVIVVMSVITPFTVFVGRKTDKLQKNQMQFKDKRMAKMSEILNSIKIIKLNAWEIPFMDTINSLRKLELKSLRKLAIYFSAIDMVWIMGPMLLASACFTAFVLTNYTQFNANTIFVSLSIFNVLVVPMAIIPYVFSRFIRSIVSIRRLSKFLSAEELDKDLITKEKRDIFSVNIDNATFKWCLEEESVLKDLTIKVRKGQLIAIVGEVGSGKSSLLAAIMGGLYKVSGNINVNGSLACVPSTAWILNATLKKNIIFVSNEDEIRYQEVISSCALLPDLNSLPAGDMTEIGEKGINLSGGQKQRVSLARAVYHGSDIYLLDDPFSAVDAHVAQHLFQKVIGPKGLLRYKTRILCTHHISLLEEVDQIFVLRDGEVVGHGNYQELSSLGLLERIDVCRERNLNLNNQILIRDQHLESSSKTINLYPKEAIISSDESQSLLTQISSQSSETQIHSKPLAAKLTEDEHLVMGSVSWKDYGKYITSTGITVFIVFILLRIGFNASEVSANYWLSLWTNLNITNSDSNDRNFRLSVYISLIANEALLILIGDIILFIASIKASQQLHSNALYGVLRSPLSFFDKTPTGRILNRFSKDMTSVDEEIPGQMTGFFEKITWFPILYGIILVNFTFLGLALISVLALFYLLYKFYLRTSRQFRRLESISNSPLQSHFCESISGVNSIRAFDVLETFTQQLNKKIDLSLNCYYHRISLNLWLKIWCSIIGTLITLSISVYIVINRNEISIGLVGLMLTYSVQAVKWVAFQVRTATLLETQMISFERLREFCELNSESEWQSRDECKPSSDWPTIGSIEYQEYSTTYRTGLEPVLQDINIVIKGGQKVAIVGRTGAGKSTMALSLFRILEPINGRILIDGIDITKIGLHDLRTKLTIICQDPTLFADSLRANLDPFGIHSDQQLWSALENSKLSDFVKSLAEGLDFKVTEGGDNMSAGQRQLVCLTRALLTKSKIIVFDEATNACDLETDRLIQKTIQHKLIDCTLLTIAHRLNTIINYDQIIVIDFGRIVEFDSPNNLLSNSNTIFYGLAKEAKIV